MDQHGEHLVAVLAAVNLVDITTVENDAKTVRRPGLDASMTIHVN